MLIASVTIHSSRRWAPSDWRCLEKRENHPTLHAFWARGVEYHFQPVPSTSQSATRKPAAPAHHWPQAAIRQLLYLTALRGTRAHHHCRDWDFPVRILSCSKQQLSKDNNIILTSYWSIINFIIIIRNQLPEQNLTSGLTIRYSTLPSLKKKALIIAISI